MAKDAQNEKGTLQYQVSQGQEDPRSIAIWEEYENAEGHDGERSCIFAAGRHKSRL